MWKLDHYIHMISDHNSKTMAMNTLLSAPEKVLAKAFQTAMALCTNFIALLEQERASPNCRQTKHNVASTLVVSGSIEIRRE